MHSQKGGTCYAHAIASALSQTIARVFGRVPRDHDEIVASIIEKFGSYGIESDTESYKRVLDYECEKEGIKLGFEELKLDPKKNGQDAIDSLAKNLSVLG